MLRVLVGFHVASGLLSQGHQVTGVDNLNSHYEVQLKRDRLGQLQHESLFQFHEADITDVEAMSRLFSQSSFDKVVHLAAEVGCAQFFAETTGVCAE